LNYVFRNSTIEFFLDGGWKCSGYGDISEVPADAGTYLWWYTLPFSFDRKALAGEVREFPEKLRLVLERADPDKEFIVLTAGGIVSPKFTDSDSILEDAVAACNRAYRALCTDFPNLRVLDIGEFTSMFPCGELMDWKFFFMAQAGMNPKLAPQFKQWFRRKLEGLALKRKKCLVVDLDNTLWGGVLGEDGMDGIKVGGAYPGNAFLCFQQGLKELSRCGVILAVCSKNNESDVLEAWEKNPFMVLRKDDFAAWRINWNDKASNIRELASELNIGLDSMVFIDDSAVERELVRRELPEVETPDFPAQPYGLADFLGWLVSRFFRVYALTSEDRAKTAQYKANAMREREKRSFTDMGSFIASLNIHLSVEEANSFSIPRIAQMTQKTNQFNLTTRRRTEAEVRGLLSAGWRIWTLSVSDRFGDSGITGCAMVTPGGMIDTFLLSCRVLGRGIESEFLKCVCRMMKEHGARFIQGEYVPSAKNGLVADFYQKNGFSKVEDSGGMKYSLDLASAGLDADPRYKIDVK
jgi:FkbH-like protein